jgi:hypothetical protein
MPLYPFCSHCVATRVCSHVETPVPPWPVDEAGFTDILQVAWSPNAGTVQSQEVNGWTRFVGSSIVETVAMVCNVQPTQGARIEWRFTARSNWARDIAPPPIPSWLAVQAVPDLTFYPEARRYRLKFVTGVDFPLRINSTKALGATENFEVASDMQYKVVVQESLRESKPPKSANKQDAKTGRFTRNDPNDRR